MSGWTFKVPALKGCTFVAYKGAKVYALLPGIIINTTQFVLHTSTEDLLDIDAIIYKHAL